MQSHGCIHYKRHCELKAPCCGSFYACRKCHNESPDCDHHMDRYAVKEMRCLYCDTIQLISNECSNCHREMAHYYCDICHLFDDEPAKQIWHCSQCGSCRTAIDNTKNEIHEHCNQCNGCMPVGHSPHIDMDTDCPICLEKLKDYASMLPGPCHHVIHQKCYTEYRSHGKYACPVCSKTYSTLDMTAYWALYDREILSQPMPQEYNDINITFLCNDCNIKSVATLNLIGYKCRQCNGYNTVTLQ